MAGPYGPGTPPSGDPIRVPDGGGTQFSLNQQVAPYLKYEYTNTYQYDPGILSMPLSGSTSGPVPVTTEVVVTVRRPRTLRVVQFEIVRVALKPTLPDPAPLANEVLLEAQVGALAPVIQPDGSNYLYGVVGKYVYRVLRPIKPGTDPLRMGASQADNSRPDSNTLTQANFSTGVQ